MSVIIDNGSGFIKSGFSSECDRLCSSVLMPNTLNSKYPVQRGIIRDWDTMESIWNSLFYNKLHVPSEEQPVLMTEKPYNPKENREKTTQIMFEKFNVPSFYLINERLLEFYATSKETGVLLSCGDGVTQIVPFKNLQQITEGIVTLDFGGKDLTDYLKSVLNENNKKCSTEGCYNEIKEKLCYLSSNYNTDVLFPDFLTRLFHPPDGSFLEINIERIKCPEALFQPSLMGFGFNGIHQAVQESILKCDESIRNDLYSNIALAGGSTLLTGFVGRLEKEIQELASRQIKLIAPDERRYLGFIGGTIFSSLTIFDRNSITRQEYDEVGPSIVHRKCPTDRLE